MFKTTTATLGSTAQRYVKYVVALLFVVGLSLVQSDSVTASGCDPNEGCNRCLKRDPLFGVCLLQGNDPQCEIRKAACRNLKVSIPPIEIPPPPDPLKVVRACIKDISSCPTEILRAHPLTIGQPVFQAYLNDLRGQANSRWQSLPAHFVREFADDYPQIDMGQVRYANNINTRHGQSMTLCYEVFLAETFDPSDRASLELMLHELYHTVQCVNRGGVGPFVDEYLLHGAGKMIERGSVNVHDSILHESDAARRASDLIREFGWPFVVKNACDVPIRIIVHLRNGRGQWTSEGWWTFAPGEQSFLLNNSNYLHTTNRYWYFYAETTGGRGLVWKGDRRVSFGEGEYDAIEMNETQSNRQFLGTTLTCRP